MVAMGSGAVVEKVGRDLCYEKGEEGFVYRTSAKTAVAIRE
jgi:hypothetical protein